MNGLMMKKNKKRRKSRSSTKNDAVKTSLSVMNTSPTSTTSSSIAKRFSLSPSSSNKLYRNHFVQKTIDSSSSLSKIIANAKTKKKQRRKSSSGTSPMSVTSDGTGTKFSGSSRSSTTDNNDKVSSKTKSKRLSSSTTNTIRNAKKALTKKFKKKQGSSPKNDAGSTQMNQARPSVPSLSPSFSEGEVISVCSPSKSTEKQSSMVVSTVPMSVTFLSPKKCDDATAAGITNEVLSYHAVDDKLSEGETTVLFPSSLKENDEKTDNVKDYPELFKKMMLNDDEEKKQYARQEQDLKQQQQPAALNLSEFSSDVGSSKVMGLSSPSSLADNTEDRNTVKRIEEAEAELEVQGVLSLRTLYDAGKIEAHTMNKKSNDTDDKTSRMPTLSLSRVMKIVTLSVLMSFAINIVCNSINNISMRSKNMNTSPPPLFVGIQNIEEPKDTTTSVVIEKRLGWCDVLRSLIFGSNAALQ